MSYVRAMERLQCAHEEVVGEERDGEREEREGGGGRRGWYLLVMCHGSHQGLSAILSRT